MKQKCPILYYLNKKFNVDGKEFEIIGLTYQCEDITRFQIVYEHIDKKTNVKTLKEYDMTYEQVISKAKNIHDYKNKK